MRFQCNFRFPARVVYVACVALLAAGMVSAQQQPAAPPADTGKNAAGQAGPNQAPLSSAQPSQVKREETEEENVYRHTPLVQSISDAIFHDDKNATDPEKIEIRARHVELTARTSEWINAIILLLCIFIPVAKYLPRVFRKRQNTLSHQLENARKTTADANARLSVVEAQLSMLDGEIAKIRAQMEEESKNDEARIKASIEEEKARIVAAAEQEIGAAAAHAQRSLRNFAADMAIEQAMQQLVLTPDADRLLIAEFINEAQSESGNGAARGGRS